MLCGNKVVDVADLEKNGMHSVVAAMQRMKWSKMATVSEILISRSVTFSSCTKADSDMMFWAIQNQDINMAEVIIERMKSASAMIWDKKNKLKESLLYAHPLTKIFQHFNIRLTGEVSEKMGQAIRGRNLKKSGFFLVAGLWTKTSVAEGEAIIGEAQEVQVPEAEEEAAQAVAAAVQTLFAKEVSTHSTMGRSTLDPAPRTAVFRIGDSRSTQHQSRSTLDPAPRTAVFRTMIAGRHNTKAGRHWISSQNSLFHDLGSVLTPPLGQVDTLRKASQEFKNLTDKLEIEKQEKQQKIEEIETLKNQLKERDEVIQTFTKGKDNLEALLGTTMTTTSHGLRFNKKKPMKDKSGEKKGKAPLIKFVKGPNLENTEIQQTANKTLNKTQNKAKTQKQKKTIRSTQSPDRSTCSTSKAANNSTKNSNKNLKNKKKLKEIIHEKPWTSKTTFQDDWTNPWSQWYDNPCWYHPQFLYPNLLIWVLAVEQDLRRRPGQFRQRMMLLSSKGEPKGGMTLHSNQGPPLHLSQHPKEVDHLLQAEVGFLEQRFRASLLETLQIHHHHLQSLPSLKTPLVKPSLF
ncbi:hypothetical protein Taro_019973 [Colocasia esculenta]|uniref:Uncharacterized protein n=1 Tax=Colocasia esculenta TaxID=4460 RepID=A0A843V3U4_COLES|nr:hypothetical protein [Colocasia esculenta]